MPAFKVTGPDGKSFKVTANSIEEAGSAVDEMYASQATQQDQKSAYAPKELNRQELTIPEKIATSVGNIFGGNILSPSNESRVRGFLAGGADMPVGIAQLIGNVIPGIDSNAVNTFVANKEKELQRKGVSSGSRLAGNLTAGLATGAALPAAGSLKALAATGAAFGASTPVTEADSPGEYWLKKGVQTTFGAAVPVAISKLATPAAQWAANQVGRLSAARGANDPARQSIIDEAMARWQAAYQTQGGDISAIPKQVIESVRQTIGKAINPKAVNPEEAARLADFQALGIQPTQGWITRNPEQWAREFNLRGIDIGKQNPIAQRIQDAGQTLRGVFQGADDAAFQGKYGAGQELSSTLRAADAPRKASIDEMYQAARDSTGRAAQMDVPTFSKVANDALDSKMLGRYVPSEMRSILNDISSGAYPLDVNTAVQFDRILSESQRAAQGPAKMALGVIRDALNNTPISSQEGQMTKAAFDAARQAAKARFSKIEASPAYKAAIENGDPERFIDKYVLGATTDEINALKSSMTNVFDASRSGGNGNAVAIRPDPTYFRALDIIKGQAANALKKAAFGADASGDKAFAPEVYNRTLQKIGRDKLNAIFGPIETERLFSAGRVMSYISQAPAGSVPNTSGTASAIFDLLSKAGGAGASVAKKLIPYGQEIATMATQAARRARAENEIGQAVNVNLSAPIGKSTRIGEIVNSAVSPSGMIGYGYISDLMRNNTD